MAYKKTYRKKKTYNKGRMSYTKGAQNAFALAKQAARDIWYLKGLVNSEMLHNQGIGATPVPSTGTITLLNGMAQNDTSSGRTGNSILMRNCFMRLVFTQNTAAVTTIYRVMLVLDKQQITDSNPLMSDILESLNPLAPLATASTGRFTIMKNWFFTTDDTKAQTKIIDYYKDFRFHTKYNGPANSDIQKNGLYLVFISDQPVNPPSMSYSWKVGYHDN